MQAIILVSRGEMRYVPYCGVESVLGLVRESHVEPRSTKQGEQKIALNGSTQKSSGRAEANPSCPVSQVASCP